MNEYLKYQERLNSLIEEKKKLFKLDAERQFIQAKYLQYLKENPHKKALYKKNLEVHKQRAKLMNLVPNNYV